MGRDKRPSVRRAALLLSLICGILQLRRHDSSLPRQKARFVLLGEWDGFCCGKPPELFHVNVCEPCQYQGPTHTPSRDQLLRPGHLAASSNPVFKSSVSAFHGASWPPTPGEKRQVPPEQFVREHNISPKDCAERYPNSNFQCFVVPRPLVVPYWHEMDVMVYLGPYITHAELLAPRLPWQKRAVITMESPQYWPHLTHPDLVREYDIHAGIHTALIDDPELQIMFEQIGSPVDYNSSKKPERSQYSGALVNFFASNCESKNDREAYVQELMSLMEVHSYGQCLHNKDLPEEEEDNGWRDISMKRKLQAKYMFSLALENASERDWVTEKLFDPLISGSIPVYMGAENVADFLPCPDQKCIVHIKDYPDPRDLAQHLQKISESDELFNSFHSWRAGPLRKEFIELTKLKHQNYHCGICQYVANS